MCNLIFLHKMTNLLHRCMLIQQNIFLGVMLRVRVDYWQEKPRTMPFIGRGGSFSGIVTRIYVSFDETHWKRWMTRPTSATCVWIRHLSSTIFKIDSWDRNLAIITLDFIIYFYRVGFYATVYLVNIFFCFSIIHFHWI